MTKRQESQHSLRVDHATASQTKTWIDRELVGSEFTDVRLNKRFRKLFQQLSEGTGESIPLVCQDWANTKAAYRFLSNHRVNEGDILAGHFQSTHQRFVATDSTVLVLHDTTEFNYHREDIRSVGILHRLPAARGRRPKRPMPQYGCAGIQSHSSRGEHNYRPPRALPAVKVLHRIGVTDESGHQSEAILEIRYRRIRVLPPIGKQKQYPGLMLTVIHAQERGAPKGRERIDWKLITDLPVRSRGEAIEKLKWYSMRSKIATFHKILKSGCKAEESRPRTAQRLTNLIAVFCILSWRIFWLTMMNRAVPDASPTLAFTVLEICLLDQLAKVKDTQRPPTKSISTYLIRIARLGGYLARAGDAAPGNAVIWRDLARLTDIELGFALAARLVGN